MITIILITSSLLIGMVIGIKLGGRTADYVWSQASKSKNLIDYDGETYSVINIWDVDDVNERLYH